MALPADDGMSAECVAEVVAKAANRERGLE
jgi:hypothetical protein